MFSNGKWPRIEERGVAATIIFQQYILQLKQNRSRGPFKSPDIEIGMMPARTPSPEPDTDIRNLFVPPNRSQTVP